MQRETSFTTLPPSAATSTTTLDIDEGGSITTDKASAADKRGPIITINADDSQPLPHSSVPRQSRLHGGSKSRQSISKRRVAFLALSVLVLGNIILLYLLVARQSAAINSVKEVMDGVVELHSSAHFSQHVHSHLQGRVEAIEKAQLGLDDRLDQLNVSITAVGMESSLELTNLSQRVEDTEAGLIAMQANLSLLNSTLGEQSDQLRPQLKDFQAKLESIEASIDEQGGEFGAKQANLSHRLKGLEAGLKALEASFAQINSTLSKESIAQMEHREQLVGRILDRWGQIKRLLREQKDGPAPFGQVTSASLWPFVNASIDWNRFQKVIIRWAYVPRCLETLPTGKVHAADCDEKKPLQLWTFLPNGEIHQDSNCLVFAKDTKMPRVELSQYCGRYDTHWVYEYPTQQLMPFNNLLNGGDGGCLEIGSGMTELKLKACRENSMLQRFKVIPVED